MDFDFDKIVDRRNSDSLKWAKYQGTHIIPMWVADMDFRSPPAVVEAIYNRAEHGIFGYATPRVELQEAVANALRKKHNWEIDPAWIVWLPTIEAVLYLACRSVGEDWDEVLTFTPVYPPLLRAPIVARRKLKTVALCRRNGLFTFDLERFERAISSRSKLLLLCNPHNPVGRVFDRGELEALAEICSRNGIVICSDEVYCDLIIGNDRHLPIAAIGRNVCVNTVTAMSPSKTYNVPGLNCAFAIIPNAKLRDIFSENREGIISYCGTFGYAACSAAYEHGEEWRLALIDYLRANADIVQSYINDAIPGLSMDHVQATFLAWINTRNLSIRDPVSFFERAGVGLANGKNFQGEDYVRLNFACPRELLLEALNRMMQAVMDGF